MKNKKPVLIGFISSLALLVVYFGILTIANSFAHAIDQFVEMWYWISLLSIGFGTQVGLYFYIRMAMHEKIAAGVTAEVAAAGGITTTSMIACCAHHIVDIIPILGISAAALFLVKYQLFFIIVGVLSNIVGIIMMISIIKKHNLWG